VRCTPPLLLHARMRSEYSDNIAPGKPTDIEQTLLKCMTKFVKKSRREGPVESSALGAELQNLGYLDQLKENWGTLWRFLQSHEDRFKINFRSPEEFIFLVQLQDDEDEGSVSSDASGDSLRPTPAPRVRLKPCAPLGTRQRSRSRSRGPVAVLTPNCHTSRPIPPPPMCKYYARGECWFRGDECWYRHG
jgi:hypothetical protein